METDPYLTPTKDEVATLRFHISQWDELDAWPKSVSVAIVRGHRTAKEIAAHLGVSDEQLDTALRQLIGNGVVCDNGNLLLK